MCCMWLVTDDLCSYIANVTIGYILQWSDDDDIGGGVGGGGGGGLLSNLLGLDDDDDLFSRLEAYDQMPCKCLCFNTNL